MRIGLLSSSVPLVQGGGRFIVDWLHAKLQEHGHAVATLYVPTTDEPAALLQQMTAFRLMKLEDYFDRVVTFRPPSHAISHPNKIVWFIHHIRVFYDLWNTEYRPVPDLLPWRALRHALFRADNHALQEARHVFTNSQVVSKRLLHFNGIKSEVLYPPVLRPELYRAGPIGEEIVSICRIEHHKRQHLLVDAMKHVRTPVRLRLCGVGANREYVDELTRMIVESGVADRVIFENRWISESEKIEWLATALAAAYIPVDEDSYGYPTIEAALAERCTLTLADSGGTLEFIENHVNGRVVDPDSRAIAEAFDQLYADRQVTRRLGAAAYERVAALDISWDHVIARILA